VAFSNDTKHLLMGFGFKAFWPPFKSKRLMLWESETGALRWSAESEDDLLACGFRPDGKTAIVRRSTKSFDCFEIWDIEKGKVIRSFAHDQYSFLCPLALSADTRLLLSAAGGPRFDDETEKPQLQLWDVNDGTLIRTFTGVRGEIRNVVLSPDGCLAATLYFPDEGQRRRANLWNVETGLSIEPPPPMLSWPRILAFSADAKLAVCLHDNGEIPRKLYTTVRDVATGKELRRLEQWGMSIAFTPDGANLLIGQHPGNNTSNMTLVEWRTGRVLWTVSTKGFPLAIAFSPDGSRGFTANLPEVLGGGDPVKLGIWDLRDGKLLRLLDSSLLPEVPEPDPPR
jgi:WD40 repeat protein